MCRRPKHLMEIHAAAKTAVSFAERLFRLRNLEGYMATHVKFVGDPDMVITDTGRSADLVQQLVNDQIDYLTGRLRELTGEEADKTEAIEYLHGG